LLPIYRPACWAGAEIGGVDLNINEITHSVIGAAIEVHRALGAGLLESAYQRCLARELDYRGISFELERPLPLEYRGLRLDAGYRVDLLVCGQIVVEVKAVDAIAPIHEAQLLTYLRLGRWPAWIIDQL
jgi:GxxExxY protein